MPSQAGYVFVPPDIALTSDANLFKAAFEDAQENNAKSAGAEPVPVNVRYCPAEGSLQLTSRTPLLLPRRRSPRRSRPLRECARVSTGLQS